MWKRWGERNNETVGSKRRLGKTESPRLWERERQLVMKTAGTEVKRSNRGLQRLDTPARGNRAFAQSPFFDFGRTERWLLRAGEPIEEPR
ncbi:MAG: hypothetical protein E5X63_11485 [Mesorhizobium sp.]|nr:MAG: hypothetical protein E5X60_32450 [Mesorhizobium sp.]TIP86577.1 MAG: hypothetical protein E5X63_11485 [Mesorhizobium sp.]TIP90561.1 MAG: hypothetical protein E5X58_23525 [Mesorhizobium sp.]